VIAQPVVVATVTVPGGAGGGGGSCGGEGGSGGSGSCGGEGGSGGSGGGDGGGEGGANGTTKDFRSSDPRATVRPSCPRPDQLAPFQPSSYEFFMTSSHSTPGERETPYSVWKSGQSPHRSKPV